MILLSFITLFRLKYVSVYCPLWFLNNFWGQELFERGRTEAECWSVFPVIPWLPGWFKTSALTQVLTHPLWSDSCLLVQPPLIDFFLLSEGETQLCLGALFYSSDSQLFPAAEPSHAFPLLDCRLGALPVVGSFSPQLGPAPLGGPPRAILCKSACLYLSLLVISLFPSEL